MELEYRGLLDDGRSIPIDDLGISGYDFTVSKDTVDQLLLNGADAIDDHFKQPRKIELSKIPGSIFFAEAAASTVNIEARTQQRSLHLFIQTTEMIKPQGRSFYSDEALSNHSVSAYPLVTYRQPHQFESKPYDFGQWDDIIEPHSDTGIPIFTYRVFKMGQEVGSAQFYEHPLLCRSADGSRHNVIETTGVLKGFDINAAIENIDDVCTNLPPTRTEQLTSVVIVSTKHGAVRGVANVIGQAMEQKGFSRSVASKAREAFYYVSLFTMNTASYYCQDQRQNDELTKLSTAAYQATIDTTSLFFTNTLLNIACKASSWLGKKADRAGWNQSAGFFKGVAQYAGYGGYAYSTVTRDPVEAGVSIMSGILAQTAVEQAGAVVLQSVR